MFLAIVFLVLGLVLLLKAFGFFAASSFWGIFWAVVFLAIGIKLLTKKGRCPMCEGVWYSGKIHQKMHEHCKDECECECECEHGEEHH